MIFADPFQDTKKSILNISAKIIDIVQRRKIEKFEQVISIVENELHVTYDKIILAINFLYMTGGVNYDIETDTIRFINETK